MKKRNKNEKIISFFIYAGPLILVLLLLSFTPAIKGIQMSFLKASRTDMSMTFNGLKNYINVLQNPYFYKILLNTICYTSLVIIFGAIIGITIALLLNEKIYGRGFFRAVNIVPWVSPPAVISIIWVWFFGKYSPLNDILIRLDIIKEPIDFLGNLHTTFGPINSPMISIIIVGAWVIYPFIMIMTSAGLQSIPVELYDAALVDGATKRQQIFLITLPLLKNVFTIMFTLTFIWTFQYFNAYLLTKGGPRGSTELLSGHIYIRAFTKGDFGYASAAGIIMMFLMFLPCLYYIRMILKQIKNSG